MSKLISYIVYLFDADGPLLNSAEPAFAAVNRVLESFDLPTVEIETWRAKQTSDIKRFYQHIGVPENQVDEAIERYRIYFREMAYRVTEPEEVAETLKMLKSRRTGVVTSMSRKSWENYADRFHFDSLFRAVVTRDDCEEQKPSPKPLYLAMEMLGIPRKKIREHRVRGIMIGDSVQDIVAGRAAGLDTAAVVYEGSYNNRSRLAEIRPTYMIPSIGIVTDRRALSSFIPKLSEEEPNGKLRSR